MTSPRSSLFVLSALLTACAAEPSPRPAEPLFELSLVTNSGFQAPTDAVASPDGETFYFSALTDAGEPAIFQVASQPGSDAGVLAAGEPLVDPSGLVLSCDGSTLYIADGGSNAPLLSLEISSGTLSPLPVTGIGEPAGLAMGPDCETLHVSGMTPEGEPAVFTLPRSGGEAETVFAGGPLVSPTGIHVDSLRVSWVMDYRLSDGNGEGVLYAIPADGSAATPVLTDLRTGVFGGVSLTSAGGTAVIPTRDADGRGQLTTVVIETGALTQVPAEDLVEPAGIRTAREASVLAVVDAAGAIYRAE